MALPSCVWVFAACQPGLKRGRENCSLKTLAAALETAAAAARVVPISPCFMTKQKQQREIKADTKEVL